MWVQAGLCPVVFSFTHWQMFLKNRLYAAYAEGMKLLLWAMFFSFTDRYRLHEPETAVSDRFVAQNRR
jgi:hypothetical protein